MQKKVNSIANRLRMSFKFSTTKKSMVFSNLKSMMAPVFSTLSNKTESLDIDPKDCPEYQKILEEQKQESEKVHLPFKKLTSNELNDYLVKFDMNSLKTNPDNQSRESFPIFYWSECDTLDLIEPKRNPESLTFVQNSSALIPETNSFHKVVPDKDHFMILDSETSTLYIYKSVEYPENSIKPYYHEVQPEVVEIATNIVDADSDQLHSIYLNKNGQVCYSTNKNPKNLEFMDVVEGQKVIKVACGGFFKYIVTSNNQLYILSDTSSCSFRTFNLPEHNIFYPEFRLNEYILKNNLSVILIH